MSQTKQTFKAIDLGKLSKPICQAEIDAAAAAAWRVNYELAMLTTMEGGIIYVTAKAPGDDTPTKVEIQGPAIVGWPIPPTPPIPPVHRRCQAPHPAMRRSVVKAGFQHLRS